jgi:hypothetical protein
MSNNEMVNTQTREVGGVILPLKLIWSATILLIPFCSRAALSLIDTYSSTTLRTRLRSASISEAHNYGVIRISLDYNFNILCSYVYEKFEITRLIILSPDDIGYLWLTYMFYTCRVLRNCINIMYYFYWEIFYSLIYK